MKPLYDNFQDYLASLIDVFVRYVKSRIEKGIGSYRQAIDQSEHEIGQRQEREQEILQRDREILGRLLNDHSYSSEWERSDVIEDNFPA